MTTIKVVADSTAIPAGRPNPPVPAFRTLGRPRGVGLQRTQTPLHDAGEGWKRAALVGVKTVHTGAFFSIGSCLAYLAYSALANRSDRRAAIACLVVTGEALIYAANDFRCPLTDLAERLGSKHAPVADIYLPSAVESHLPMITGPIFAGALILHAKNIAKSRRKPASSSMSLHAGSAIRRSS